MNNDKRAASIYAQTDLICLEMGARDFFELLGPLQEILTRHQEVYQAGGEEVTNKLLFVYLKAP